MRICAAAVAVTASALSAADFAESLGANRTVTVRVKCPLDDSNAAWSLLGQEVSVEVDCDCTIKEVKSRLKAQLGMPENKQQLKLKKPPRFGSRRFLFFHHHARRR